MRFTIAANWIRFIGQQFPPRGGWGEANPSVGFRVRVPSFAAHWHNLCGTILQIMLGSREVETRLASHLDV
jgi:hypothetical protein